PCRAAEGRGQVAARLRDRFEGASVELEGAHRFAPEARLLGLPVEIDEIQDLTGLAAVGLRPAGPAASAPERSARAAPDVALRDERRHEAGARRRAARFPLADQAPEARVDGQPRHAATELRQPARAVERAERAEEL